jgi:hypothetical protein
MMSITANKKVQRLIETGAGLVILGIALNVIVTWTLGSFDAASVLLALYVGLWAYALGSFMLIALSVKLFLTRKSSGPERKGGNPQSEYSNSSARDSLSPAGSRLSPVHAVHRAS